MINIRFFAILRERLGVDSLAYEYSDEKTVNDIKQNIIARGEPWTLLAEQDVLIALNQTLTSASARVNDGDEIAFFPPVTGG
ncbi:molybdopterin converting factor subunit 1 [Brumicola pallidula]|jgi:molybdopterin synthase sulfur carrier subunit|uniref:Molybdopterin synthase sulfur carrier subunit n=1 Tax=Brumicola pallidula DSM 14239 = ACAM 615 TaxID=1121922 RepID=K6Z302_9ALTE|nr:molybdopterin converting factor subunit 1 [Glaciecola pallidula]GAC30621.1 molybdopterin synthase sulfur carrier subunit [Glaciecola pallidula DSM 14239 = ACAM 615]